MGFGVNQRFPWPGLVVGRLVEERKLGLDEVLGSERVIQSSGFRGRGLVYFLAMAKSIFEGIFAHTCSAGEAFLLMTPVYSSRQVSARSRSESTTSTTPRQLLSTSSTSSSSGAFDSVSAAADWRIELDRLRRRAFCSSSAVPTSGLRERWKPRSSAEIWLTVRVVEISAAWIASCNDLNAGGDSIVGVIVNKNWSSLGSLLDEVLEFHKKFSLAQSPGLLVPMVPEYVRPKLSRTSFSSTISRVTNTKMSASLAPECNEVKELVKEVFPLKAALLTLY